MRYRRALLTGLVTAALVLPTFAADWPQFRGPGGSGVAQGEKNLPTTWGGADGSNIVWKVALPGPGASSPIIVGDKVLLTCYSGYGVGKGGDLAQLTRHLICFNRAGKLLWDRKITTTNKDYPYSSYQRLHGYASATPACDGKNVYVFLGVAGVLAFDLDGKELWRTSVGTGTHDWGSGTSPVLAGDLVIVNASVESNSLVALHKKDGKVAWKAKGMNRSWTTPALVTAGGRHELVVSTRGFLSGYDPQTGSRLWYCQAIEDYVCPSVIAHDDVVYAIGGRSNTAVAVKAGGKGDVTKTHLLWTLGKGSNVSSPVYYQGHLYWASESNGTVYCVKASDGTLVYTERLQPGSDRIYASATVGDGKIYYVSRERGTYVVAATPEFKQLAHNTFAGDRSVFNASPAIADGRLYLRSDRFLYCIGKRGQ